MAESDGAALNAASDRRPVDEKYCPTCGAYQPLAMNEQWRIRCERSHAAISRDVLGDATPRPWEVDPAFVCDIGHPGLNSEGEWDARVAKAEDPDDAALIVRAVNEYEALLIIERAYRIAVENLTGGTGWESNALARLDALRGDS